MDSIVPTLALCVAYVIIVKFLGPWYMKGRDPYKLKTVLIIYNALQVVFSVWQFYEVSLAKLFTCLRPVNEHWQEVIYLISIVWHGRLVWCIQLALSTS